MNTIWTLIKSIFSRCDYSAEPEIQIPHKLIENPVVVVKVGNKILKLSTAQARKLWGKLGQNLEQLTPDPNKYQK